MFEQPLTPNTEPRTFSTFVKNHYIMLKKLIACTAILFVMAESDAQQLRTPQPSTSQTIKQDFGIGSVELSYSRPNMKGRKIFGDLVPFGKLWRTGANSATKISFSEPVEINGKNLIQVRMFCTPFLVKKPGK